MAKAGAADLFRTYAPSGDWKSPLGAFGPYPLPFGCAPFGRAKGGQGKLWEPSPFGDAYNATLSATVEVACLLAEADGELAPNLPPVPLDLLRFFFDRPLRPGYDPLADDGYVERVVRLGQPSA